MQYDSNGGEIHKDDSVRVDYSTSAWAQGFRYGKVTKVGHKWVTVSWSMNEKVTRRFAGHLLTVE